MAVHMMGHDHVRSKVVMPQLNPASQGCEDETGNAFLAQPGGPIAGRVEIAIHPDETLSAGELVRGRIK